MPVDRRDRMFRDQEQRLLRLRVERAEAGANAVDRQRNARKIVRLDHEIEVREAVLDELRGIE